MIFSDGSFNKSLSIFQLGDRPVLEEWKGVEPGDRKLDFLKAFISFQVLVRDQNLSKT